MDVVTRRRQLHRWPEPGFTEFWTAATVIGELQALGYQVRWGVDASDLDEVLGLPGPDELADAARRAVGRGADPGLVASLGVGGTGVVADLRGHHPGPVTALRFDMDALPIDESTDTDHRPTREDFRSENDGHMHACGHDGHVAIGLALAARLADGHFPGTVRLIFEPAEEGGRGAAPLVAGGAVAGVDRLLCLHLGMGLPVGTMAAASVGFFANTKLRAVFTGRAAHAAAAPEEGRNALLGAATALLSIHALPRFASAATRVNVGILRGGAAPNIIAAHAELSLEVRATDGDVNAELVRRVGNILDHAAGMHELEVSVETIGRATTADCDRDLAAEVARAASAVPAFTTILESHDKMASDDATLMMRAVQAQGGQATYILVGASSPGPHHSPSFDLDEASLGPAVALLEHLVRSPMLKAASAVHASRSSA
jgi:aminobenzoyl-glutamate utilization protein A